MWIGFVKYWLAKGFVWQVNPKLFQISPVDKLLVAYVGKSEYISFSEQILIFSENNSHCLQRCICLFIVKFK